jgi:hypothetical protein
MSHNRISRSKVSSKSRASGKIITHKPKKPKYKNHETKRDEKMKAQIFSLDTIIGVVIFLVVFTVFFAILTKNTQQDTTARLNEEAQILLNRLTTQINSLNADRNIVIVKSGRVIEERIDTLMHLNYDELKASLGIQGDFCIFLEDKDGKVINISDIIERDDVVGIGYDKINISGLPCQMG